MTSFFLARSRMPVESLAVMPVLMGLVFLFRTGGIAAQEVVIALHGEGTENTSLLRRFTGMVGLAGMAGVAAVLFTPLASVWLRTVSGLSPDLAEFALLPGRLLVLLPLLEAILGYQRGILVRARMTNPIMAGVVAQIGVIVGTFWLTVVPLGFVGAVAAGIAQTTGYLAGNGTLAVLAKRHRAV